MLQEKKNQVMQNMDEIKKIVGEKRGCLVTNCHVPLAEYGLDSLAMVELVVELEKIFGIEFPDSTLNRLLKISINDIAVKIEELK